MVEIRIGTAGWDYKDWIGPFYPKTLDKVRYLTHYSYCFDVIEVNSTFYNILPINTLENWISRVPSTFQFILKVWQKITHEFDNPSLEDDFFTFLNQIKPLGRMLNGLLLQFPPWFKYSDKHFQHLSYITRKFAENYRMFIELRNNSWFEEPDLTRLIDGKKIILVTSYLENIKPYYFSDQEIYYIRLIGDREITKFDKVQKSQDIALSHLYSNIKKLLEATNIREIFIIVNNHFSGFAPETVNQIKKELNLTFKDFSKQKKLTDFF
jgi:uncharacterized protein YecE (DUF72 family)